MVLAEVLDVEDYVAVELVDERVLNFVVFLDVQPFGLVEFKVLLD